QAEIRDDAVDPRIERTLKTEIADVTIRFQESFLINVLRILLGTGQMKGQLQNSLVVLPHECLKRSAVTTLSLAYQIGIVYACRNRACHACPCLGLRVLTAYFIACRRAERR